MLLLNFGHPLTAEQLAAIESAVQQSISDIREIKTQFDHERPFAEQAVELVNTLNIDTHTWQTTPFLINPPTFHLIALVLMAELNGRMGYFPSVIRLKPVQNSTPPRYMMAEIVNLQAIRDGARTYR